MSAADKPDRAPGVSTHTAAAGQAPGGARDLSTLLDNSAADEIAVDDLLPLAIPDAARRGRGRPVGSTNVRSERTARMLVGRYGDPLAASLAIGNMKLGDLVTFLRTTASDVGMKLGKVTLVDLLRFQEECRRNVMPYIHGKRAQTDDKGAPVLPVIGIGQVNVQVNSGAPSSAARSIEDVIDQTATEIICEQDQGDSDAADE